MESNKLILETNIMLALMKATIEQSEYLRGELKQKPKQVFKSWSGLGHKLLDELEKRNIANEKHLEDLTDIIHDVMAEIRVNALKHEA